MRRRRCTRRSRRPPAQATPAVGLARTVIGGTTGQPTVICPSGSALQRRRLRRASKASAMPRIVEPKGCLQVAALRNWRSMRPFSAGDLGNTRAAIAALPSVDIVGRRRPGNLPSSKCSSSSGLSIDMPFGLKNPANISIIFLKKKKNIGAFFALEIVAVSRHRPERRMITEMVTQEAFDRAPPDTHASGHPGRTCGMCFGASGIGVAHRDGGRRTRS